MPSTAQMAASRKPATPQRTNMKAACNHRKIALSLTPLIAGCCVNYRVLFSGVPAVMSPAAQTDGQSRGVEFGFRNCVSE